MPQYDVCKKELCVAAPLLRLRFFVFFLAKKSFYVSMYALKTPKNKNIQTRCQGHFRTRLFTRLLLDNFILIARLRQNANFSSLVCSIALFCLLHVGEKITCYICTSWLKELFPFWVFWVPSTEFQIALVTYFPLLKIHRRPWGLW